VTPRSEDPHLIIRVINFELVQPICSRYINVTDGQTDGRTAVAALAIDKAGPCHFRPGPTSGPTTRPGSQKSKISTGMLMRPECCENENENETRIIFRGRERDQHYENENETGETD